MCAAALGIWVFQYQYHSYTTPHKLVARINDCYALGDQSSARSVVFRNVCLMLQSALLLPVVNLALLAVFTAAFKFAIFIPLRLYQLRTSVQRKNRHQARCEVIIHSAMFLGVG
ncbi:hypothetical protein BD410DRAFT_262560 [Rickenella mellea]|uniref:Uncharacterized protein n=1 Tax=Rickenella mellea TaxID=50990 RepID=A0A4Y7Q4E3_9AGAM|nr:hypothetical protein BD410DRAFT_262560 [Rickenella mellea]